MKKLKSGSKLGKKLKKARTGAGMSQKQLAAKLKLSDKAVSAYEVGRAEPSLDVLRQISKLTQVSVQYFTDEMPEKEGDVHMKLKRIEQELAEVKKLIEQQLKK
jgi:transcriptional regulator with XRE-family HTH domain